MAPQPSPIPTTAALPSSDGASHYPAMKSLPNHAQPTIGELLYSGPDVHRGLFHPDQYRHNFNHHGNYHPPHQHQPLFRPTSCSNSALKVCDIDHQSMDGRITDKHSAPSSEELSHRPDGGGTGETYEVHHRHHCTHDYTSPYGDPEDDEDDDCIPEDAFDVASGGAAEAQHFDGVCEAFANYTIDSMREVSRMESHLNSLSEDDQAFLIEHIGSRIQRIKDAVKNNQHFLNLILLDQGRLPMKEEEEEEQSESRTRDRLAVERDSKTRGRRAQLSSPEPCSHEEASVHTTRDTGGGAERGKGGGKKDQVESNRRGASHGPSHSVVDGKMHVPGSEGQNPSCGIEAFNSAGSQPQQEEDVDCIPLFSPSKPTQSLPLRKSPTAFRNISKVRSTLRQFVRDWSEEGKAERDASYQPLLDALEKTFPLEQFKLSYGRLPRILCPGSGLGRLPFEVVRRGYACQGNEFSYFMLLGSNLLLNSNIPSKSCVIQPYCLSTSNRDKHQDHLVEIRIPDVSPVDVIDLGHDFSMCAGEFVEVYWEQEKQWDGVLTCFFIDTAKNVLQYIRTIARLLPPQGLWANLGPLLYHFSDMPNEVSVELSWEEIRSVIARYFTIQSVEWRDAFYTTNPSSMMQVLYHCVHFVAIRNEVEVVGVSKAVY